MTSSPSVRRRPAGLQGSCTKILNFSEFLKFVPKLVVFVPKTVLKMQSCFLISEIDADLHKALWKIVFKRVYGRFQLDP